MKVRIVDAYSSTDFYVIAYCNGLVANKCSLRNTNMVANG